MTATAERIREIGFPWFDRHAVRGGKEIFAYSHARSGMPIPQEITGVEWRGRDDLRDYYRHADLADVATLRCTHLPGYVDSHFFATWEEAEAWLFALTVQEQLQEADLITALRGAHSLLSLVAYTGDCEGLYSEMALRDMATITALLAATERATEGEAQ